MAQFERLYKLKDHLDAGHCLSRSFLLEDLQTEPSSLKRDRAHRATGTREVMAA